MTTADHPDRAIADPIGLISDLVADIEKGIGAETIRAVVTAVAGGRAKSRRLAEALATRPAILTDGRSPAPRAIGDLLIELRKAGASAISPPVCAECGKKLRTFQRQGQDWYCSVCGQETTECTACGNVRRIGFRDRKGLPRCKMCPDHELPAPVAELALHQVEVRRSHAVLGRTDSPWLFPGGQPGRPISAWAMGERLRKLGIRLGEARSTALFQLASELPAAVLARTLGIDITVAVKWQRAAAGDWAAYAAEVSQRPVSTGQYPASNT
ncbi:hypothetical protein [Streptomyces sp. NPDC002403]